MILRRRRRKKYAIFRTQHDESLSQRRENLVQHQATSCGFNQSENKQQKYLEQQNQCCSSSPQQWHQQQRIADDYLARLSVPVNTAIIANVPDEPNRPWNVLTLLLRSRCVAGEYEPSRPRVRLKQHWLRIYSIFVAYFCLSLQAPGAVSGIGCFVCSSFSGSNAACEDVFNSTVSQMGTHGSVGIYQFPCWSSKKQRKGLFPADHCVKVNGYRTDDPTQTMVIRTCALDSGTLTADTEIVRVSHCGYFKYDGSQYTGCVQACDTDGCNAADVASPATAIFAISIISIFINFYAKFTFTNLL